MDFIEKLENKYSEDREQSEVIFSDKKRLLVEGPAGYGKTETMIGKIAFIIGSNNLQQSKKILALTFSVNAAYKIKKTVTLELPKILSENGREFSDLNEKIFATNYHGFCRKILELYGDLIHPQLKSINSLKGINDSNSKNLIEMNSALESGEVNIMTGYNEAIRNIDKSYLRKYYTKYLEITAEKFLNKNYIPYNAIILFVLELFKKYPEILKFFRRYFSYIFVDEFQDTNILNWVLLKKLIIEKTNLILIGDPLQRIYGFIGAIPDIMSIAKNKYEMKKITLKTNHRFKDNKFLFDLDSNIRKNAKNIYKPEIKKNLIVDIYQAKNQEEEAYFILNTISKLIKIDDNSRIAILIMSRSNNINKILEIFKKESLSYFYALYSDEDEDYKLFHKNALDTFISTIGNQDNVINESICREFLRKLQSQKNSEIYSSLLILLETFIKVIFSEYKFLEMSEKNNLIMDTLENNALKQYLGYVKENLVVTTIHGAKGLEWDYVILPDLEQYSCPNWLSLCEICDFKSNCIINWKEVKENAKFGNKFYDALNLFYVACTRAKKDVFFSYSKERISYAGNNSSCNMSCFLKLKGFNSKISTG